MCFLELSSLHGIKRGFVHHRSRVRLIIVRVRCTTCTRPCALRHKNDVREEYHAVYYSSLTAVTGQLEILLEHHALIVRKKKKKRLVGWLAGLVAVNNKNRTTAKFIVLSYNVEYIIILILCLLDGLDGEFDFEQNMEAQEGFEPSIFGLQDRRLTTWPLSQMHHCVSILVT